MNMLTLWTVKFFFDLFLWWGIVDSGDFALAWIMLLAIACDLLLIWINLPKRRAR